MTQSNSCFSHPSSLDLHNWRRIQILDHIWIIIARQILDRVHEIHKPQVGARHAEAGADLLLAAPAQDVLLAVREVLVLLAPVRAAREEETMDGAVLVLGDVPAAGVVCRAKEEERFAWRHGRVGHLLDIGGSLVIPQVRAGNHQRGTILHRRLDARNQHGHQHVIFTLVSFLHPICMVDVVVLVVPMQPLRFRAGPHVEGHTDAQHRVSGVGVALMPIPVLGRLTEEVIHNTAQVWIDEPVLARGGRTADEGGAAAGFFGEERALGVW